LTHRQRRAAIFVGTLLLGASCALVPPEHQLVCKGIVKLITALVGVS